MRKGTLYGLVAALGLACLPAVAADNGIYIGASGAYSGIDIEDETLDYDEDAIGYKLIAGWRFIDWLSVEANYVDFGAADSSDVTTGNTRSDASGVSLSALGFLPVGPVDLFARVGAIDWESDVSSSTLGDFGSSGTDVTYGVGVQFRIWSFSLRAEFEVFDFKNTDVKTGSLGFTWTFF